MSSSFTQRELRDAFGLFATGVTVVTALRPDGRPAGVTANSFSSVSLEPPLLLWCLAGGSSAVPAFVPGGEFAVHVLSHAQQEVALHFARRMLEKFETQQKGHGRHPPRIAHALCRFDCSVHAVHPAGDHLIVVGQVHGIVRGPGVPLAFHGGRFGSFTADPGAPQVDVWQGLDDHWY